MLLGAEVLWEEKLSYYDLMEIKVSEGVASFNSELQNDPIDPESATFNPEWFDYYEPELIDFSSPEFIFVAANDPSLGKNKKSDTSSIINLALSTKTGYMYVADASVERRKPDVIIDDVFEMNRRLKRDYKKGFYKFGVEVVQFQYFFKEVMAAKSAEEGEYIPIEEIQSTVNKVLRIESLQPVIKNKYLKFNREHKTLLKQLQEFPWEEWMMHRMVFRWRCSLHRASRRWHQKQITGQSSGDGSGWAGVPIRRCDTAWRRKRRGTGTRGHPSIRRQIQA